MGVARDERAQLSDLFDQVGPEAPTLCDGWLTRDLAAHLVVRERRLDAAIGIIVKPLAGHLENVQRGYADKPWRELVDLVRNGPPPLSPYRSAAVDELVNTTEFFVHHEDVRRATVGWEPRPADQRRDEALWKTISKMAKVMFRKSPVGVLLRTPDGHDAYAKRGRDTVEIVGTPGELVLYSFGRDQARVEFDGEQSSIAVVQGLSRGL
ncbi:MAG: TIGR03085 family metal-binding protein [Actinomycetota bacterium]|nr:TIGR03085 family metal-binding protein [Actinomycetota bacterium]